jgi:hypothetical protein
VKFAYNIVVFCLVTPCTPVDGYQHSKVHVASIYRTDRGVCSSKSWYPCTTQYSVITQKCIA